MGTWRITNSPARLLDNGDGTISAVYITKNRYWVNRVLERVEVIDSHTGKPVESCSWSARWDEVSANFYIAWEDENLANRICARLNSEDSPPKPLSS